ncbi:MAG: hypothetical protein NTW21_08370 [Verrucomicrobia bacterium]|nr:hypothetical protein [Verrucomicrobiota bacterium]
MNELNQATYTVTDSSTDPITVTPYTLTVTVRPAPALVIHEPFAQAVGDLNGQAAGTGLAGTWNGNDQINVVAGCLSWGNLLTSGNHAVSSGLAAAWWNNGAGASPGTTLSAAGMFAPGAELWHLAVPRMLEVFRAATRSGRICERKRMKRGVSSARGMDETDCVAPSPD